MKTGPLSVACIEYSKSHIELCNELKHDISSLELLAKIDRYIVLLEETVDNLSDPTENPYD